MATPSARKFRDQEDIKAELRRRGHTAAALARAHNVAPSVLGMAFLGPSKKGELIIAKALRLPPHEVWPDRWNADGTRRVDKRQGRYSRADAAAQRLIAEAR